MDLPSGLRWVGLVISLLGMGFLWRRRANRVLERGELLLLLAFFAVGAVALVPGLVNILPRLTGFTGELSRITSLLTFAVLFLIAVVSLIQSQLDALRLTFFEFLKRSAVDHALELEALAGRTPSPFSVAVVMPAFNEAENLAALLPHAPSSILGESVRLMVVDDGSTDNTVQIARDAGALVIQNPVNAGGGHALKVGFLAAQRLGARFVVTMDADGQHRFEDLPTLLKPLLERQVDVVVGSRHLGESVGHEAVRALGLRIFNTVLTFLVGRTVTDCSSGFRAFRMEHFGRLKLIQIRHHTAELIIEASRRGLRCEEAPITILPRTFGESKKGTTLLYGLRFAHTILSTWWRR